MDYRKRLMILQRASESTRRRWSVLEQDEEPEMNNIRDITQQKDDSDTEDYVSQVLMGALLENFLFKLLIIVMIVSNCIIMAFQTDAIIAKKYDIAFSICEHIILTVFIWEILVKWYYGFNIFWKNGWNVLDCLVTLALMLGPLIFPQVFGVTLFSAAVPSAFGDLFSALYTLFICITQDGWMDIYREFKADEGLMYGASLYFFIFLTGGAFIFANLLVAVVTTNLEISMPDYDDKNSNECLPAIPCVFSPLSLHTILNSLLNPSPLTQLIPEATGGLTDQTTIHVEEVVTKSNMTRRQKSWKGSCVENLTMDTFEELALAHVIDSNTASAHLFQKGNMRHAAMRLSMDSQLYYPSTSIHVDAGHSNTPSTHQNTG
ncbi:unnamed protein product [Coregonus sp. 'balchen']|nr:unnamed protein product [Coregonus sp. 'balchen']